MTHRGISARDAEALECSAGDDASIELGRGELRYHVVLKDEENEERKWNFDDWQAEIEARSSAASTILVPDRYPGRPRRRRGGGLLDVGCSTATRRRDWHHPAIAASAPGRSSQSTMQVARRSSSAEATLAAQAAVTSCASCARNRWTGSGPRARLEPGDAHFHERIWATTAARTLRYGIALAVIGAVAISMAIMIGTNVGKIWDPADSVVSVVQERRTARESGNGNGNGNGTERQRRPERRR